VESQSKTFGQKLWDVVEGPLGQTGMGLVLLAIGAVLSSKSVIGLAFPVFLVAAYRAKLFQHDERYRKVISCTLVPLALALLLIGVWAGAWKIRQVELTTEVKSAPPFSSASSGQEKSQTSSSASMDSSQSTGQDAPSTAAASAPTKHKHPRVVISSSGKGAQSPLPSSITRHDLEISDNHFGRVTTVLDNAGKVDRIYLKGNVIQPSSASQETHILKNEPGGDMTNVTGVDNQIEAAPTGAPTPNTSAAIGTAASGRMDRAFIEGNEYCANGTLFNNAGNSTNLTFRNNSTFQCPTSAPLDWHGLLEVFGQHRGEIQRLLDNWSVVQEKVWAGMPDDQIRSHRLELNAIEVKLLAASAEADSFSAVLKDLEATPPHFSLPRLH